MALRKRISQIRQWLAARMPQADFWQGSATALRYSAWTFLLIAALWFASGPFTIYRAAGVLFGVAVVLLAALALRLGIALIAALPPALRWSLVLFVAAALGALAGNAATMWVSMAVVIVGALLLGGGLAVARRRGWRWQSIVPTALGGLLFAAWLVAYLLPEWPTEEQIVWQPIDSSQLQLEDPGSRGTYSYTLRHYGSGQDPQRPEFAAGVDYVTESVDGSKLLDGWEGRGGWGRSGFFQASADSLPIQGRAWIPDGPGPFPIVLIVHGNHSMEDFSDVGYGYLGELFASRGIVAVSVDQNFLNSSFADFLGAPDVGLDEENDARGWLLLKHLEQWRSWNNTPDHPLYGKADLERVVLIGHSRGGEAVSEAAVFNALPAYPDDATLAFDFDFGLRGVIAIAPVDTQYDPRNARTTIRDVNYLVIHGSHDGDVSSYAGYATYGRTRFEDCDTCFKAGFYLIGANHGQFNTAWGRRDFPLPSANALNLRHIMDPEEQRAVAATLFSAFLEVVLFDSEEHRPFLAAPDRAAQLFPEGTRFLSQFTDAGEQVLADYSEDDDVATGTLDGVSISGEGLAIWRERELELKWHKAGTTAAIIGWNARESGKNEESEGTESADLDLDVDVDVDVDVDEQDAPAVVPRYVLNLPDLPGTPETTLSLSLAPSTATPGEAEDYEPPEETDFSLVLEDANGRQASLPLSSRRPLVERIDPRVLKLHALQSERSEVVFQRYRFELGEWAARNPDLDITDLRSLSLVFDRTEASSIIIEQVMWSDAGL